MADKLNIALTLDEVNAVINVLGQMPTSSGAWPLLMNIREQAQAQLPDEQKGEAPALAPDLAAKPVEEDA